MKQSLETFLQPSDHYYINSKHHIQNLKYGFFEPPTRKQLLSLRYLVEELGVVDEVKAEQLLGLSKTECKVFLKRLNELYLVKRKKSQEEG